MGGIDRKKEVLTACLDQFVKKGLYRTTSRDLSKALKLQNSGLYYYFDSKDEAVIACAEEASFLLEDGLIIPAFSDIADPDKFISDLFERANKLAPMMCFLFQVCSANEYRESMKPALFRLNQRFQEYAKCFAKKFDCSVNEFEPYFSMCITSLSSYMLFGEYSYIAPQIDTIKTKLEELLDNAAKCAGKGGSAEE